MRIRSTRLWTSFVYMILAAFVAQGLVANAHVHAFAAGKLAASQPSDGTSKPAPNDKDGSNCPICQVASLNGAFVASAAQTFHVPLLGKWFNRHDERTIVVERFAQHWRSRAPPAV